jgi:hypothetical protein
MQNAIGFATGRVAWVGASQSKGGKPFTVLRVELSPREYNGRTFRRQIEAHDYQQREAVVVGDFVTVAGDIEARTEQGRDGKTYGKLQIVGRIQKLDVPVPEATTETNEEGATHEPA